MRGNDKPRSFWRVIKRVITGFVVAFGLFVVGLAIFLFTYGHPDTAWTRPLMPTPVLYQKGLDPFVGAPADRRHRHMKIFYATDRAVDPDTPFGYGEEPGDTLSLGACDVEMVSDFKSWERMTMATLSATREESIGLRVDAVHPMAGVDVASGSRGASREASIGAFLDALNASIDSHRDKRLNVFVHGAITQFGDAMTMVGDYHHFCGRRSTWLAFAWPAHPKIYQYALGEDDGRIERSAGHFARLLEILGEHSHAERINIVCWSAGGRLVGDTLSKLHDLNPGKTPDQIRRDYKLGHIVFCSSDESFRHFMAKLERYHDIPRAVVYTLTDEDIVLEVSSLIDDTRRVGDADSENTVALSEKLRAMPNVAVLDVSYAKGKRGFDITGHYMWLDHPWVSSDIILNLLTDWPPDRRGLEPTPHPNIWGMTERYPGRVQDAATKYFSNSP